MHQRHTSTVREVQEDGRERLTFRKVSFWQHLATYLLYFVMLMNVFVTTFGISGGAPHSVFGYSPEGAYALEVKGDLGKVSTTTMMSVGVGSRSEGFSWTVGSGPENNSFSNVSTVASL